jgi:hypothetical protein
VTFGLFFLFLLLQNTCSFEQVLLTIGGEFGQHYNIKYKVHPHFTLMQHQKRGGMMYLSGGH